MALRRLSGGPGTGLVRLSDFGGSGGSPTNLPVPDDTFIVKGNLDPTKRMRFEVDTLLSPAVDRVLTVQDKDGILVLTEPRKKTVTWSSSMTLDWADADIIIITLAGNTTITHTQAKAGQSVILVLIQDATGGRTVTFTAETRGSVDLPLQPTLTATATAIDYLGFIFNSDGASKFDWVAITRGFGVTGGTIQGAPVDASYLTLSADSRLTAERVLTAGRAVQFVDTGANGTLTVNHKPNRDNTFLQDEFLFFNAIAGTGTIGELGWGLTGGTATVTAVAGLDDHPGIVRLDTGLVPPTTAALVPSAVASIRIDDVDSLQSIVRVHLLASDTDYRFGLMVTPSGNNEDSFGVYFSVDTSDSANWRCVTRDAAGAPGITVTNTAVAVVLDNWVFLELRRNGVNWEFYINNVLLATHTTNIPNTTVASPAFVAQNENDLSAAQLDIDFFLLESNTYGQRWT